METPNAGTETKNKCGGFCNPRYLKAVARVFLSAIFVIIGFTKLTNFAGTAAFIGSAGLPMPEVFAVVAIIFELGGGLMLLFGWRKRLAINMLISFTVVATALFHIKGLTTDQNQTIAFLKNLAIVGGLLALRSGNGRGRGDCEKCKEEGGCKECGEREVK